MHQANVGQVYNAIDLNGEILQAMCNMGFKQESIATLREHPRFKPTEGQEESFQRNMITLALHGILVDSSEITPSTVRLGLQMANNASDWLNDIKLIVLPYMQMYEDRFFPS